MQRRQDVSTTEVSPPTEPLTVAPTRDARKQDGHRKEKKSAKAAAPVATSKSRGPGRTTRVVLRRLDPWSVLKLSLVYYAALFVVILVAGVLLWMGASAAGVVTNIEDFMIDIGFEDFRFVPSELFGGIALGGLVLVVAGTLANLLLVALFNLMGDIVGGLRLTLQEDVAVAPATKDDGKPTI